MTPEQQEGINNFTNALGNDPENWDIRTQLAKLQFNAQQYDEAAATIWTAPEIPSTAASIALASRILAKAHPRKSLRLLTMALESTKHKPANLMALAEELMAQGMVLAATRFYGAATASDMSLADADFEAWLLWTDHHQKLWGDFTAAEIQLGDAPWLGISATREDQVLAASNDEIDGIFVDELSSITETPLTSIEGSTPGAPPALDSSAVEKPVLPEIKPSTPSVDSAPVPTREEAWGGGTIAPPAATMPPPPSSAPPPPSAVPSTTPQAVPPPAAVAPPPAVPQQMSPPVAAQPPSPAMTPPPAAGIAPLTPPSSGAPSPAQTGPKKLKLAFPTESDTLRPSQRVSENVDE